jgi:hypothetical protein
VTNIPWSFFKCGASIPPLMLKPSPKTRYQYRKVIWPVQFDIYLCMIHNTRHVYVSCKREICIKIRFGNMIVEVISVISIAFNCPP